MTKTYVGQVGLEILAEWVGLRCLRVPPSEPVVNLEPWQMMICPVRRSRVSGDFKPQLYVGAFETSQFGFRGVLPGIYGQAALCL